MIVHSRTSSSIYEPVVASASQPQTEKSSLGRHFTALTMVGACFVADATIWCFLAYMAARRAE